MLFWCASSNLPGSQASMRAMHVTAEGLRCVWKTGLANRVIVVMHSCGIIGQ